MDSETVEQARQKMVVLTLAFMAACVAYAVVAVVLRATGFEQGGLSGGTLWALRAALAFACIGTQVAVGRFTTGTASLATTGDDGKRLAGASTRTVVRLASAEAIAICGLLLFLLGGSVLDAVAFSVVALVVMAVRFPTRERWAREVGATATGE